MEKRLGNMIIQTPGGTAAKGSNTYKVSLPSAWIKELGITAEDRQVELSFDGKTITIAKRLTPSEFLSQKRSAGHEILQFFYYDGDTLCSLIAADFTDQTLCAENYVSDVIKTAFGNNMVPTWVDFQSFLEERCIPHARAGLREYLEALGLDEYDPLEIIKKTSGRMAEDKQWIEIKVIS